MLLYRTSALSKRFEIDTIDLLIIEWTLMWILNYAKELVVTVFYDLNIILWFKHWNNAK